MHGSVHAQGPAPTVTVTYQPTSHHARTHTQTHTCTQACQGLLPPGHVDALVLVLLEHCAQLRQAQGRRRLGAGDEALLEGMRCARVGHKLLGIKSELGGACLQAPEDAQA